MKKNILFIALLILSSMNLIAQEGKTYKSLEEALKTPELVFSLDIRKQRFDQITGLILKNLRT